MKLCECGCGSSVTRPGNRFLKGHHARKRWEDYPSPVRDPETGCLRWRGPHHSEGYGKFGNGYAHREAYRRVFGEIPEDHQIDHVQKLGCAWRDCIEPFHLEAVTQAENVRRQVNVIAQMKTEVCPDGHRYEGHNLIVRRGKRECRKCIYKRNNKNRRKRRQEARGTA